jgi:hypothetical protein
VTIRFYADTHIAKAVAEQLRTKGVDIMRCEDVGLQDADDETHLIYASQEDRVLVTQDADFVMLHISWLETGRSHGGIMRVPPELKREAQISFVVKDLYFYYEAARDGALDPEIDIRNQLIYL